MLRLLRYNKGIMKNITKISVASLASLGLALSVFAQTTSPTSSVAPTKSPEREEIRENAKKEAERIREETKKEIEDKRETTKQAMEQKREGLKQEIETKREELKDRLEQKREELKDRIETKREELKQRLEKIKNETKKRVVEKIDKSLDALNERMTKHFISTLEKLEDVLARIGERTSDAADKGIDVSSVDLAIVAAQTAINEAKASVEAQAAKNYSLTISTEDKLKTDIGKTRQLLHEDLKVVYEKVKVARNAVHEAARAFAKAHGRDLPSLSPSVSPSPTPVVSVSPTPTT